MTVDIANMRKLLADATPGEWTLTGDPHMCCDCTGSIDLGTNAALVAAMHNTLPELLDELERKTAALEWIRDCDPEGLYGTVARAALDGDA